MEKEKVFKVNWFMHITMLGANFIITNLKFNCNFKMNKKTKHQPNGIPKKGDYLKLAKWNPQRFL